MRILTRFNVYDSANMFRDLYPSHSVVMTQQFNLFGFPHVVVKPFRDVPLITNVQFASLARSVSPRPGRIVDRIEFGAFFVAWSNFNFVVFVIRYAEGFSTFNQYFLLHEGDEEPARELLLSAGLWDNEAHQEIWVFNQGMWRKDAALFQSEQQADWKDVILKDEFKEKLQKDVYGFFTSEHIYKELAIPWKRGIMMYGPPGNGKTISLKVIMKECSDQGFTPLYVKSFTSYMGDEAAMEICFNKARQLSPCVLVLEDLDSLITDRNRSFFLNQLDGLQGNDGMLVIGTTNHLSKIDGSLTNRPSRFDRKFLFDNPDLDERMLYAQYWQRKLENNTEIDFPDALLQIIVDLTDKFSFAYLKEAL
ncbi:P-loop containing nucleoside triphosphate hydrolase protein [Fistulina hepatica ATCC 64428]|nr:P-loop containing nucleoside triphosphate hydrolase protein [Fistulina hepatica ATCC 64428]